MWLTYRTRHRVRGKKIQPDPDSGPSNVLELFQTWSKPNINNTAVQTVLPQSLLLLIVHKHNTGIYNIFMNGKKPNQLLHCEIRATALPKKVALNVL